MTSAHKLDSSTMGRLVQYIRPMSQNMSSGMCDSVRKYSSMKLPYYPTLKPGDGNVNRKWGNRRVRQKSRYELLFSKLILKRWKHGETEAISEWPFGFKA